MKNLWFIFLVALFTSCGAFNVITDDIVDEFEGIGNSPEVNKVLRDTLVDTSKLPKKANHKPLDYDLIQKIIEGQRKFGKKGNSNDSTNGCACVKENCGCCAHVAWKEVKLDETVCVNVSYLSSEMGFRATMTIGKHTVINETVSVKNPPSLCYDIPHLKNLASICIRFHDLDVENHTFKGCIAIEARLVEVIKENLELGCFSIPVSQEISSKPVAAEGHRLKVTTQPIQTDDRLYFKPQKKYGSSKLVNLINP